MKDEQGKETCNSIDQKIRKKGKQIEKCARLFDMRVFFIFYNFYMLFFLLIEISSREDRVFKLIGNIFQTWFDEYFIDLGNFAVRYEQEKLNGFTSVLSAI